METTIEALYSGQVSPQSAKRILELVDSAFGRSPSLKATKNDAKNLIAQLGDEQLVDALGDEILEMADNWRPQLRHVLAPVSILPDWDWLEHQIREHRQRKVENPCLIISAGGQYGIGSIPSGEMPMLPKISDSDAEVLVLLDTSVTRLVMKRNWADLRAGKIPGGES